MHPQQPLPEPSPRRDPQSASASSAGDGPAPAGPRRRGGDWRKRDERAVRHFALDHILKSEDRPAYEAMMADPRQTNRMLRAWLQAKGYRIGYQAVQRHRRHFELNLKDVRRNALVAHQFSDAARAVGSPAAFTEASQTRLEQLLLERLFTMTGDEKLSGRDWAEFAKAVGSVLSNRRQSETMRAELEERMKRTADTLRRQASGNPHAEVAERLRKLLGVTPENAWPDQNRPPGDVPPLPPGAPSAN